MSADAARRHALAALLSIVGMTTAAGAACPRPLVAWGEACAATVTLRASVASCAPGRATVDVELPGDRLAFELRADGQGFVTESGVGLSPVGQFDDWKAEPAARREALDAVRRCVRDAAPPLDAATTHWAGPSAGRPAPRPGVTTFAALLGLALVLALSTRRLGARAMAAACALGGAAFAARWWVVGAAFFHQNGQGPLWTSFGGHTWVYGPGYDELMALPARLGGAEPERAIFATNAALAALAVPLAFATARAASGSRALGWTIAAIVALDPVAARVGASESYFAPLTTLAWAAALGVTLATRDARRSWLPLAAAALLVAASARVHPVAWAPLACLALVPLAGPRRGAVAWAATTAATLGLGTVALAAGAMLDVLRGPIGQQWARASSLRTEVWGAWLALAAGLILLAASRGGRGALGGALVALSWAWLTFRLEIDALVAGAYLRLAAPPIVALAVATPLGATATRVVAAAALGAFAWWLPAGLARATSRATDAEETTWALQWRRRLAPSDDVCFVARAQRAVLALPLGTPWAGSTPLDPSGAWSTAGCTHYYRGALCSTVDAEGACNAVEAGLKLEPLDTRTLPARPSLPWLSYRGESVSVGLFRVVDSAPRAR